MAMLDHHHAFKRSHTVNDLGPAVGSPRAVSGDFRVSPISTATAIASVADKTKLGPVSPGPASPGSSRTSVMVAMNTPAEDINGKSAEELRVLIKTLQKESKALKTELEVKKSGSGSGGSHRSPSIVVDFSEPRHQHRPSVMAQNLEQIK